MVFSFPQKAPNKSVKTDDRTAIEQLEFWLLYQSNYTEHKPSVTITVKEHEWLQVGSWVYENFDKVSGVSFLPHSDHVYKQAPYEAIDKNQYDKMVKNMPIINWNELSDFEVNDNTSINSEFACTSGKCEI